MGQSNNTWIDRTMYPFESLYLPLKAGKMHYIDEGSGDETLLFVHGTPTWSFLYREFIKDLSNDYRCIAIDHLGFGLSENPLDFVGIPENHSKNLEEFITKLQLKNITVVVHDFGGPIGLGAAQSLADKIDRIVLMNSWCWETASNPEVQKIDELVNGWLGKFFYLNMNFSAKVLVKKAFADKKALTKKVHQHYINAFPSKESRRFPLMLAQSLLGSSNWYQRLWDNMSILENKEWLVLWGMQDPFLTSAYLDKWKNKLPRANFVELSSGHFVQDEAPKDAILEIRRFLKNLASFDPPQRPTMEAV